MSDYNPRRMKQKEERPSGTRLKNIVLIVFILICLGVLAFSGFQLWNILSGYHQLEQTYSDLADETTVPAVPEKDDTDTDTDTDTDPERTAVLPLDYAPLEVDFDSLLSTNPDVVGWLYCPDSNINYPLVQGSDNSEYIHSLWDGSGTYNSGGSIFLDSQNSGDLSDQNTIIYGHNMKNGSMFHDLRYYYHQGQDYYDSHPYMYLMTPNGNYRLEVFACQSTSASSDIYTIAFGSLENYASYLNARLSSSTFVPAISVTTSDRIVTLSTCAYLYDNARYVVQARLVEIG